MIAFGSVVISNTNTTKIVATKKKQKTVHPWTDLKNASYLFLNI